MSEAQTQTQGVESGAPGSPFAHESELPSYETHKLEPQGTPAPPPPSHAASPMARGTSNVTTAPRTETSRCLETSKGKKWLQLFVKSRATSQSTAPIFFEGDIIAGRVELDLDKAEGYKGVTISIQGGTTFVGQEEEVFLKQEHSLWTPSGKESKLSGKYSWPFEFTLPKTVDVKDGELGKKSTYQLPPSFTERASPAYIDYKIIITLKRGFLRVNQTLVTNVGYQPLTFPDPPSHLRRLAYSDASLLIGPSGDPDGWKVLPPVQVKGTLFNVKEVEVTCTLAIATPLSYAPGSPIPLHATFTCEDTQALDILAEPSAIQLLLRRSLATGLEATDDKAVRRTDNHFYENSAVAYFWQSWEEGSHTPHKRVLQGEVEVTKALKPSFKFPNFCVRYSLDLFPFKAAGFSPAAGIMPIEGKYPLFLSVPVEITTRQTRGVTPHSYAPPGYEKPQIVDYNKSLGVLENGNQRFLGHSHGHGH